MYSGVNEDLFDLSFEEEYIPFRRFAARKGKSWRGGQIGLCCMALLLLVPGQMAVEGSLPTKHSIVHRVTVTAYTNVPECTDSTPDETASLLRIKPKHYWRLIALSRDLARGYKFGDRFILRTNGKAYPVEFQDLMAPKQRNKVDFLLPSVRKSLEFGVKEGVLIPVKEAGKKTKPTRG